MRASLRVVHCSWAAATGWAQPTSPWETEASPRGRSTTVWPPRARKICRPFWVSVPFWTVCDPGVTRICATVGGMAMGGSASSNGCSVASGIWFSGVGSGCEGSCEGSSVPPPMAVTACETAWSTGSSWPATVRPSTCEEPVSAGLPLTQLPEAVALESLTPSSGFGGGGSSEARACVMSTLPRPGTGIVVVGMGMEPAGRPTDRLATSPVAPAVCCAGWLAVPSSVVRADMTLACSGSGSAGRFAPPLGALHVVWPELAVTGVPSGAPLTAAAEQFQPAAEADADMTTKLAAAAAATTQSILRTRNLLWDREHRSQRRRVAKPALFPLAPELERRTAAGARRTAGARSEAEAPGLLDDLAVGGQAPAGAQVADEVPVQGALVLAAGLRIRAPESEVDGAADLLVVEDRAGRARDAEGGADPDLAQEARAVVGGQRALQVLVADRRAARDDLAVAQLELHAVDVDPGRRRADGEAHAAVGALLVRAGEDLAAGHVAPAVGVDPRAAGDAEGDVGALGLEAQLARRAQAADQAALEGAQAAPGPHRVGLVEEQRAAHEGREVLERHARLRGERLGRPQRRAPALLHRRLADRAPRAGVARDAIGVHAGELAHVAGCLDAHQRVDPLGLCQGQVRIVVEVAIARVRVVGRRLPGQLDAQQRPRLVLEDRALELEQERRRQRGRAHEHALAALHLEAVAGEEVGERRGVERTHGASRSGKCSARCSRSTSRIQRRSSWVATRRRMSSSRWPSVGTSETTQRTARCSKSSSVARCQASSWERTLPCRVSW